MKDKVDNLKIEDNKDKIINNLQIELEKEIKRRKRRTIIFIIIIIILLIFFFAMYRMGKIGDSNILTTSEPYESTRIIQITEDNLEIQTNTQIDIFENEKFNGEKIIAPKSYGQYDFFIKNTTQQDIIYDIEFLDEMQNFVNMKYRLKMDNVYIKGNKDIYVDIDELGIENIIVPKDSINRFTIEWYWEDDDEKDTYVGSLTDNQYYTLKLSINAELYNKTDKE